MDNGHTGHNERAIVDKTLTSRRRKELALGLSLHAMESIVLENQKRSEVSDARIY